MSRATASRTGRARWSPEARPIEEVDVLVDGPPHEHHDLVVDRGERAGAALLQRRVVLDEALRRGDGSRGRLLGAGAQLRGDVGPREDREDEDRHDRVRQERRNSLR